MSVQRRHSGTVGTHGKARMGTPTTTGDTHYHPRMGTHAWGHPQLTGQHIGAAHRDTSGTHRGDTSGHPPLRLSPQGITAIPDIPPHRAKARCSHDPTAFPHRSTVSVRPPHLPLVCDLTHGRGSFSREAGDVKTSEGVVVGSAYCGVAA